VFALHVRVSHFKALDRAAGVAVSLIQVSAFISLKRDRDMCPLLPDVHHDTIILLFQNCLYIQVAAERDQ
jgi:hypothetical protein